MHIPLCWNNYWCVCVCVRAFTLGWCVSVLCSRRRGYGGGTVFGMAAAGWNSSEDSGSSTQSSWSQQPCSHLAAPAGTALPGRDEHVTSALMLYFPPPEARAQILQHQRANSCTASSVNAHKCTCTHKHMCMHTCSHAPPISILFAATLKARRRRYVHC